MRSSKAIIIGSGVAGLAIATRLAIQGYEVHVFEKNSYPGGKLSNFKKDGYHFDAGPSLFTQPANMEELFSLAGESIEEYFTYTAEDIACHYFFENGKRINAFTDKLKFAAELQEKTGEQPKAVIDYLNNSQKLYDKIGTIFLNFSLHRKRTWFHKRILHGLKAIRIPYIFGSMHQHNSKNFSTKEAIQIFDRFATYNGSNPYKAPGMLTLIPHLEQNEGTFYPKGGMISIVNALYKLAEKKGVHFHFNQAADRIIHHEGFVRGIVSNGQNIDASIVVSNADIHFTYKNLLLHLPKASQAIRTERSSSAIIFYWGINKQFSELGLHNIFFSKDYKNEFTHLFKTKTMSNDPTVYINISSKNDEGHAPAGKENWFVMVNAPANYGQDWKRLVQQARVNAVSKINAILQTDIESFIESETILDPAGIEEKTGSYMGALYGSSSNSKMAAFFRPANFTSYIKGLYCCGGTVHPGGGIPLCMKSAKIVSDLIQQDNNKISTHT